MKGLAASQMPAADPGKGDLWQPRLRIHSRRVADRGHQHDQGKPDGGTTNSLRDGRDALTPRWTTSVHSGGTPSAALFFLAAR